MVMRSWNRLSGGGAALLLLVYLRSTDQPVGRRLADGKRDL